MRHDVPMAIYMGMRARTRTQALLKKVSATVESSFHVGMDLQARLEEVEGEYRAGKTTAALSGFFLYYYTNILWCQHACR